MSGLGCCLHACVNVVRMGRKEDGGPLRAMAMLGIMEEMGCRLPSRDEQGEWC